MSVFVTGGCGFIGSWIVRQLVKQSKKVIIYDLKIGSGSLFKDISDNIVFVQGSVLDYPRLVDTFNNHLKDIEGIIHAAAVVVPQQVTANPHYGVMVNTVGSLNMLEVARVFSVDRIVCIGSGAVYGNAQGTLSEDKTPVNPSDLYGATKAATERFGMQYVNHYGIDFRSVRLYFVYGPGIIPSQQNILYRMVFGPLEGLENLELDKGGDQEVDYTYVKDSASGVVAAYTTAEPKHRVFNVSSGVAYKVKEIVGLVRKHTKVRTQVKIGPGLIISRGAPLDISRAKRELGYKPKYDLEKGISEYADWLQRRRGNN